MITNNRCQLDLQQTRLSTFETQLMDRTLSIPVTQERRRSPVAEFRQFIVCVRYQDSILGW